MGNRFDFQAKQLDGILLWRELSTELSQVRRLRYIDRGYANLETKLRALGADIVRVPDPDSVGY